MISSVRRQCGRFPKALNHVVARKHSRKTRIYLTLSLPASRKVETVKLGNLYLCRYILFLRKKNKRKFYNALRAVKGLASLPRSTASVRLYLITLLNIVKILVCKTVNSIFNTFNII